MPVFELKGLGQAGSFPDLEPADVPLPGWQQAQNVRFVHGRAYQSPAPGLILGSPPQGLTGLSIAIQQDRSIQLMAAGPSALYIVDHTNGRWVDVTGTATWAGAVGKVSDTHLGSNLFFNDGNNVPAWWDGAVTGSFQPLANWPAGWSTRRLRAYREYLIALGPTDATGTEYPYMVKWSDAAPAGGIPATWDPADATADAGEYDLGAGFTPVVDGYPLRDLFMVYRQTDTWIMQWVGGEWVFSFQQLFKTAGMLAADCMIELNGLHYVATVDDIIMHDGQTAKSLLDRRARRTLFSELDVTTYEVAFMTFNRATSEILFCYPTSGSPVVNRVCAINVLSGAVSFLDWSAYQPTAFAVGTVPYPPSDPWDSTGSVWDSTVGTWSGAGTLSESIIETYLATNAGVYRMDADVTGGPAPTLEKRALDLGDPLRRKTLKRVELVARAGAFHQAPTISLATTEAADQAPAYDTSSVVDLAANPRMDVLKNGRFFHMKIEGGADYDIAAIRFIFEWSGTA